jgi:hypothetical protein
MPRTVVRFSSTEALKKAVRVSCEAHLQKRFSLRWRDISRHFALRPAVLTAIAQLRTSLKRIAEELPSLRRAMKTAQRERASSTWYGVDEAARVLQALSFFERVPKLIVPNSRLHVTQCAARVGRATGRLPVLTVRDLAVFSLLYGNWPRLGAAEKPPSPLDIVRHEERYLRQYMKQRVAPAPLKITDEDERRLDDDPRERRTRMRRR